jgi:hypothetical protein
MPRLSRRTHLSIGLLLLSCMIIAMIFGGPLFGRFVFEELRDRVLAESGGRLFVESFSADFFKGRFQFTGFVYEEVRPGQRSISLSAKEGTLDISIGSLFGSGSFIIEELRLVSPVVKYRQERAAGLTTSQGALRQGIYLKKLQLQDGQVWFDDLSGERPVHIELTSLQMSGEELSTHQPLQLCSHVSVSARLEGEPVGVQGSGVSSGWQDVGVGLAESCRFQGIPTAPLLPYLLGQAGGRGLDDPNGWGLDPDALAAAISRYQVGPWGWSDGIYGKEHWSPAGDRGEAGHLLVCGAARLYPGGDERICRGFSA